MTTEELRKMSDEDLASLNERLYRDYRIAQEEMNKKGAEWLPVVREQEERRIIKERMVQSV